MATVLEIIAWFIALPVLHTAAGMASKTTATGCSLPETFENGKMYRAQKTTSKESKSSVLSPGQSVTFYCNDGFELSDGPQGLVCQQDNSWSGTIPKCKSNPACPDMFAKDKTGCPTIFSPYLPGTSVKFTCNPGSYVVATNSLTAVYTCNANGTWDKPFRPCSQTCPVLEDPENGNYSLLPNRASSTVVGLPGPGALANFVCNEHFGLVGEHTLKCLRSGAWDKPVPICVPTEPPEVWYWPFLVGFFIIAMGTILTCSFMFAPK